jgi:hypothetical protein
MRKVLVVCAVLLFAGMAFGQATVLGGYATNIGLPAGWYPVVPFVPLVVTPEITFVTFSPSPVGASNATAGNVAGASNATLDFVAPPASAVYTVPVWTGSAIVPHAAGLEVASPAEARALGETRPVQTGVASFAMGPGTAEMVRAAQTNRKPAGRVYTNQDVQRMNEKNGTVKWDGKTEHIG